MRSLTVFGNEERTLDRMLEIVHVLESNISTSGFHDMCSLIVTPTHFNRGASWISELLSFTCTSEANFRFLGLSKTDFVLDCLLKSLHVSRMIISSTPGWRRSLAFYDLMQSEVVLYHQHILFSLRKCQYLQCHWFLCKRTGVLLYLERRGTMHPMPQHHLYFMSPAAILIFLPMQHFPGW